MFIIYNEYIIINCVKGIALFYIKTKEIYQYIQNYQNLSPEKEIFLDINNNICVLNKRINQNVEGISSFSIIKYNLIYGALEPFEETQEIIMEEEEVIKIISLTHEYLLLCQNNIYSLKELEEQK